MPLLFIIIIKIIIIIIKRVSSVRLSLLPVGTVEHPPSFHFFPTAEKTKARRHGGGGGEGAKHMQVNSFLDSFLPSTVGGRKETPSLRPDSYLLEIFSARAGFTVSCVCREPSLSIPTPRASVMDFSARLYSYSTLLYSCSALLHSLRRRKKGKEGHTILV
jgi:hypothetical protein